MTHSVEIISFGKTDIGVVRSINEDAIFISEDRKMMIVLDGVGGSSGGHVASNIGTRTIEEWYKSVDGKAVTKDELVDTLFEVNSKIKEEVTENPGLSGMATTACLAYIDTASHQSPRLHVLHIGDSRAYIRRKSALLQITLDHNWHNSEVLSGHRPLAEVSKIKKNSITQSLGSIKDKSQIEYSYIPLYDGDIIMLTTDGIHDYMAHKTLNQFLGASESATENEGTAFNSEKALTHIVEYANAKGGHDNASIILAKITIADSTATNLLPKHNSENWLFGKESGELVYTAKVESLEDERLENFYRLATPAGESLLVKDRDKLAAILQPKTEAPPKDADTAKTSGPKAKKPPEVPVLRKKTSKREYAIGAVLIALVGGLMWYYLNGDQPLVSKATETGDSPRPQKSAGKTEGSNQPVMFLAAAEDGKTDSKGEASPQAKAPSEAEAKVKDEATADRTESEPQPNPASESEQVEGNQAEPSSDGASKPPSGAEHQNKDSQEEYFASATIKATEEPNPGAEAEAAAEEGPIGADNRSGAPQNLEELSQVNSKVLASLERSRKRLRTKDLQAARELAEPSLSRTPNDDASAEELRAYDALGINYLTAWLLDKKAPQPSEDQSNLVAGIAENVGTRNVNDSYFQTILSLAELKILGSAPKAITRLGAVEKQSSQYIYDNLVLAQLLIDHKKSTGQSTVSPDVDEDILATISPLITNDLNYMKLYEPAGDVVYIKNFRRLHDYRGVYSYIRKSLPKKEAKYLSCKLQFLEMKFTNACLNSVDTIISKNALKRYTKPEDHQLLDKVYHLRFQLGRKQYKRAAESIEAIEKNKSTNKFDGYLAFARAAIAEGLNQDKADTLRHLENGKQIDPNFRPVTSALAQNTTVKTTF